MVNSDWEKSFIKEIATIYGRIGFRGYTKEDIVDEYCGAISLSPSNIINNVIDTTSSTFISWQKYKESPEIMLNIGDVVLVKTGSTYGKSAYIHELKWAATLNPQIVVFKRIRINNKLFAYLIQAKEFQKQINSTIVGGAIPTLSQNQIYNFEISFPKKDLEQQQIADALSDIDNLISSLEKLIEKKKAIKEACLQKMFPKEGETVPEMRLPGFTEPWEQRKLSDMCSLITKQTGFDYSASIKPSLVTEAREDTYPFIQNKDFDGENINLNTDFYIPISVAERFPKITLDTPSLLISISGKIGNVGYYRLKSKAFIGGAVGICKLLEDNGRLLVYALQSDAGQRYFQSLIKASSHANITVEDIRNIEIYLPKTTKEYKFLEDFFHNLDNLITLHQRKLEKCKKIKQGMMQQLLTGKIRLI